MSEVRKPADDDDLDDEDDDEDIFRAAFSSQKNGAKVKIENDETTSTSTKDEDSLSKMIFKSSISFIFSLFYFH